MLVFQGFFGIIKIFSIKHVGINTINNTEAENLLQQLMLIFDLERGNENNSHVFAGTLFEVMKNEEIGTNGHIALQTEDVEDAIKYFSEKKIGIKENTIKRDENEKNVFAYLDVELGGFAFHLTV